MEGLTEEERRALRGSKFAPLPPSAPLPSRSNPRLAHPGGPLKTNKAAALAKFLERKLQDPSGLASINPDLIEQAVKNAKETIKGGTSNTGRVVQHVSSFGDSEVSLDEEKPKKCDSKKINKKKKNFKKKSKRQKVVFVSHGHCFYFSK
ncbi:hypothetical protein LguiB_014645 [Lonicera macranthoides]